MVKRSLLIFFYAAIWVTCDGNPALGQNLQSSPAHSGWTTYADIRDTLNGSGEAIDYDTLLKTYHAMIQTRHPIPHMDQLLLALIDKRNSNPRVDQIILIYAAHALGQSKYPVPDAHGIFETILTREDRLSSWVLAFVAEAIGDYRVVLPEGNKLVDRLEAKLARVAASPGPEKEDYGQHFLPPPKGPYIPAYLSKITSMEMRESERRHYYILITNGHKEAQIENALKQLQSNGMTKEGDRHLPLLKRLAQNPDQFTK